MNYVSWYDSYTSADFCIYPSVCFCFWVLWHLKWPCFTLKTSSKTFPLLSLKPSLITSSHRKVSLFWNPRTEVNKYFSPKCQIVNILRFAGLVTATQLPCSRRAATENSETNNMWLYSRKFLFANTGSWLNMPQGLQCVNFCYRRSLLSFIYFDT